MVDYGDGEIKEVCMHDGSVIVLKKLNRDYDPHNRAEAFRMLEEANANQWLITGLVYIDEGAPTLYDQYDLVDEPLNRLDASRIRPAPETIQTLNAMMF